MLVNSDNGQMADDQRLIEAVTEAVANKVTRIIREAVHSPTPEYLTPKQASLISGISIKTLEKYRHFHKLNGFGPPFLKISGRVRYPAEGFRKWLETFRQK